MPVNPVERRAEVARAAADLIVEGGLNAVTFRSLAARLGCSTTVISHFFRDHSDVLSATYQQVTEQAMARRDALIARTGGDLLDALADLLPVGETQRRTWTVWLCFWTAALFDAALLEEHRRGLVGTRERVIACLHRRGLAAEAATHAAEGICNALYGIALQALFDPAFWDPARQRRSFREAAAAALGR